MFKQFFNPIVNIWEKLLKSHKLPKTLRSTLLLFLTVILAVIALWGAVMISVIALLNALR